MVNTSENTAIKIVETYGVWNFGLTFANALGSILSRAMEKMIREIAACATIQSAIPQLNPVAAAQMTMTFAPPAS